MAEAIAAKALKGVADVTSAGTGALDGYPASDHSVAVARSHGLDLTGHRSTFLNATLVREADLIVALGARHRDTIGVIDPSALERTVLMTDLSNEHSGDVPDPIGGGIDVYERTYNVIETCIKGLAEKLRDPDREL